MIEATTDVRRPTDLPAVESRGARDDEAVVGRLTELASVGRFLDDVLHGPSCLVLEGEMGVGKTALWNAAVASAKRRGYRVLSCRPAESEQSLAFAGLGDLLDGTLDDPELRLPEPQDRALRVAVLMADPEGPAPDQRSVSVATLGALRCLSSVAPLLIAIDDVQWLDRASARVLEFALRRLDTERIGVIAAIRAEDDSGVPIALERVFASGHHSALAIGPLDPDALDALFRAHLGGSVPRAHLAQIAAASGGNPLFALELGRAVLRGDLKPVVGEPLSVPPTLQQLIAERLADLPTEVRELLFLAAAVPEPSVALVTRASEHPADVATNLEVAVSADVVQVADGRITFTHPLFASTLYHAVPPARRTTLHRRLGGLVSTTDERARHLALGASGPDPRVADVLDEAARAAAARGAPDAAADLHEQAYQLTPPADVDARNRRRTEAAECHFAAGDLDRARQLLEATVVELPEGPRRASVLRRLAKVRYRSDSCAIAAELLTRALAETGDDASLRAITERDLAWAVMQCGDMRGAAGYVRSALERVRAGRDGAMLGELLAANAMAEFLLGNDVAWDVIRHATDLEPSSSETPIEWRPSMMLAMMQKWSGDSVEARRRFEALHQQAVESGEETSIPFVLTQLSETATRQGDWQDALRYADEAQRVAMQTGQELIRAAGMYSQSLAEAHLGNTDSARRSALAALDLAEGAGSVVTMMLAQSVLGFVDLSLDDPAGANAYMAPLVAWLDVVGIREPGVLWFIPEQVEALVGIGELKRADALLVGYEADAARLGRAWSLLAAARARALLTAADGDARGAATGLDHALARYGSLVEPFERARSLYVLGTIRRRTRQRRAAREALEAALEEFEALGAQTWCAKARHMLGRSDGESRKEVEAALTPAEHRVARLVADGATNREAASRLFVSVRTVELHLTSIYRKLDIRSRTELAVRLVTSSDAEGSVAPPRQPEPFAVHQE